MAELKLSDLPVMAEVDFTDNDRFVMVDDGKARAMTKLVFQSWLTTNVKGERGEQGVAGSDGKNGTNGINGANGNDGLSAYQVAVQNGFVGTQSQWIASLKGVKGDDGINGSNGWSPNFKIVARGDDSVLHLFEWIGGTGTKPTTTGYLSGTGIVANILNATNIRGLQGVQGIQGVKGETGASGDSANKISSISYNDDLAILVTNTDASTVTSSLPPKKQGWGTYKDGQYTDISPMNIAITTEQVLPNNSTVKIESLPTYVSTFYDPVLQKYLLTDSNGYYNVRVRFKVIASATTGTINLSMSKATTDTPFSEDKTLRGDNKIQEVIFNAMIYGDTALSSNGLTIILKTFEREISIYNIEVTVAKIM